VKFCMPHWTALREAIDARGMAALVAESGEQAGRNLAAELTEGSRIDNFDPLMGAHNAIVAVAMDAIKDPYQQNPMMIFADESEHPDWACPICALYWCHEEHHRLCTQEGCDWPESFDWESQMINGAADHMLATWKGMQP
jgi:hypothetical protein